MRVAGEFRWNIAVILAGVETRYSENPNFIIFSCWQLLLIWKVKLLEKTDLPGCAGKLSDFFGYLISTVKVVLHWTWGLLSPALVKSQPSLHHGPVQSTATQDIAVVFARHHQKASYRDVGVSRHPLWGEICQGTRKMQHKKPWKREVGRSNNYFLGESEAVFRAVLVLWIEIVDFIVSPCFLTS